jgi:hypothetical protein
MFKQVVTRHVAAFSSMLQPGHVVAFSSMLQPDMKWLSSDGEEPEYSSWEYKVPMMDWMGHTQLIKARGVNCTGMGG